MLFLFPDTNTLLHFERPDQIDWPTLLETKPITIVVTPILVRELEDQKITNRVRRLRERAQSVITWLSNYFEALGPVEIRSNVFLQFVRTSPTIDFAAHRLSVHIADDELIATVIEFGRDYPAAALKILTADAGLRLKLPAHGIAYTKPPENKRLPQQPDELERENAQLKRELHLQASRRPRLSLAFSGGDKFATLAMLKPMSAPKKRLVLSTGLGYVASLGVTEEQQREYLAEFSMWVSQLVRCCACNLLLSNTGGAEATDVQIELQLPSFVKAIEEPPQEPRAPRSYLEPGHLLGVTPLPDLLRQRDPTRPIAKSGGEISFQLPRVVHNRTLSLGEFYFYFPPLEEIQSFSFGYRITFIETLEPIEDTLNVTVIG